MGSGRPFAAASCLRQMLDPSALHLRAGEDLLLTVDQQFVPGLREVAGGRPRT